MNPLQSLVAGIKAREEENDTATANAEQILREIIEKLTRDWDAQITQCALFPNGVLVFKVYWADDAPFLFRFEAFRAQLEKAVYPLRVSMSYDGNSGVDMREPMPERPYHLSGIIATHLEKADKYEDDLDEN